MPHPLVGIAVEGRGGRHLGVLGVAPFGGIGDGVEGVVVQHTRGFKAPAFLIVPQRLRGRLLAPGFKRAGFGEALLDKDAVQRHPGVQFVLDLGGLDRRCLVGEGIAVAVDAGPDAVVPQDRLIQPLHPGTVHQPPDAPPIVEIGRHVDPARRPVGGGGFQAGPRLARQVGLPFQRQADLFAAQAIVGPAGQLDVTRPAIGPAVAGFGTAVAQPVAIYPVGDGLGLARQRGGLRRRHHAAAEDLGQARGGIVHVLVQPPQSAGFGHDLGKEMRHPQARVDVTRRQHRLVVDKSLDQRRRGAGRDPEDLVLGKEILRCRPASAKGAQGEDSDECDGAEHLKPPIGKNHVTAPPGPRATAVARRGTAQRNDLRQESLRQAAGAGWRKPRDRRTAERAKPRMTREGNSARYHLHRTSGGPYGGRSAGVWAKSVQ